MDEFFDPRKISKRAARGMTAYTAMNDSALVKGPHATFAVGGGTTRQHTDKQAQSQAQMAQTSMNSTYAIIAVVVLAAVIFMPK